MGWLLGPELAGQLNKMLRKRSDPRDWMPYYRGCVHDECWKRDGSLTRVSTGGGGGLESGVVGAAPPSGRPKRGAERLTQIAEPTVEQAAGASSEVWFDYLSDAGDAGDSMYAVAYATMVSFEGDPDATTWSEGQPPKPLSVVRSGQRATLPRGQFVFFGGDTAYHISDAATLRLRLQEPFNWAFQDGKSNGHIAQGAESDRRTRRIYGIPGNHDWYDNIEGFSLVFRLGSASAKAEDKSMLPVPLPELERVQLASYVAIQLPFGWQLWGLDIDGGLDGRQQAYFESLSSERLIVATPSPAIAFGASIAKPAHRKAAEVLKVPIPKVPLSGNTSPSIRLDVSGDIHHYARYYPRREGDTYGSVVSGLGGAFHHPSFSRASFTQERIEPAQLYPTDQKSRERVADSMLRWSSAWFGSWARVVPFALTLLLGFAATYSKGGAWLLEGITSLLPGFSGQTIPGGPSQHGTSWLLLVAILFAGWGIHKAIRLGMLVYQKQFENPGLAENILELVRNRGLSRLFSFYRSYMYCWLIGLPALGPLLLSPLWLPDSVAPGLDLATLVILFGLPLAGAIAGWKVAAHNLATRMKCVLACVGTVHALAQILTCLFFARLFTKSYFTGGAGVFAILVASAGLYLARPLYKSTSKLYAGLLALLPLVLFVVAMTPMVWLADGQGVARAAENQWGYDFVRYLVSGGFAMPLGTTWFVWYLAVSSRLGGHNNEAGGAARVTEFRQIIRFNLRADGLTGYVIAIHNPNGSSPVKQGGKNLEFSLIDVFTLPTPPISSRIPGTPPTVGEVESGFLESGLTN